MIMRSQRGVYLILMSFLLAVLVGFGALVVDLGRIYVLRSEMQNAADAAAIAAAKELDSSVGAVSRASDAARNLLQHNSSFSEVNDLLGGNITLDFFCAIGSQYDPSEDEIPAFCSNGYTNGRSPATNDAEARYVRVNMTPSAGNNAFSIRPLLLPVLRVFQADVDERIFLSASATAGYNFYMCNYPPVMLCNPFEESGAKFSEVMSPGEQIQLKAQGSDAWSPGNFSFLQPDNVEGGGAPEIARYLANEAETGCKAPIVTTATGGMTNQTANGLNTRFDIYRNPGFGRPDAPQNWPPAPNVVNYPNDQTWRPEDDRFGNGDWDRETYFATYHDWQLHGRPGNWSEMTRWEIYNWEIAESKLPSRAPLIANSTDSDYDGIPDIDHLNSGASGSPASVPERRVLYVAVMNCQARKITGSKTFPIVSPEGFARLFVTEHVKNPPDSEIWVEYIDWASDADEQFHTDIQIYE